MVNFQQGRTPLFYRDHPQDIRHRTVQSRKPPPQSTHLIRGDPDSATSPSKYRSDLPDVALAAAEGQQSFFSDIPADFAPLVSVGSADASRPFRTLSTTESEPEVEASKPLSVQKKKQQKKKRKSSQSNSKEPRENGTASTATPSMVSFLQTKDKNVSHIQIESFIHKSKVKYSVDEIRTAIENAKSIGDDPKQLPEKHQKIVQKWQKIIDVIKKKTSDDDDDDDDYNPGGSFSKSKSLSTLPPKSNDKVKEGQMRLKLIKDARSAQKYSLIVPNTPMSRQILDEPPEEPEERPPKPSKPQAKQGKGKSKKEDPGGTVHTLAKDVGKKSPLALATYKKGSKKPILEMNPTEGFYKDYRFIYVILPEPVDELPRE